MYELRPVYPNELYHHGIKNQQWGVQNGPPYPLDRATHRAVVKQERKAAKAEYKNARQDVRNSAHQLLAARKEAAKYGSSKNERKQAIARDASAREKFYDKQYKQSLAKYRDAASRSGGKVKYNENSLKRAAFLAGNHNATGVLAQQAFGLIGAAVANRANNNSIRRWAAGKESGAKFDRFANQKKFAEVKARGNRHNGSNNQNIGIKNGAIVNDKAARNAYYKAAINNGLSEKTARWLSRNATEDALLNLTEPKALKQYMAFAKRTYE